MNFYTWGILVVIGWFAFGLISLKLLPYREGVTAFVKRGGEKTEIDDFWPSEYRKKVFFWGLISFLHTLPAIKYIPRFLFIKYRRK